MVSRSQTAFSFSYIAARIKDLAVLTHKADYDRADSHTVDSHVSYAVVVSRCQDVFRSHVFLRTWDARDHV